MDINDNSERLKSLVSEKLGEQIESVSIELGDVVVKVKREMLRDLLNLLKIDAEFQFNLLLDITAVDWLDSKDTRFEVVYHLRSLNFRYFLRVKTQVPEDDARVDSVIAIWSTANFLERETWDMYGIKFEGHPDLRRILMYDEFEGHPLRKDYPLQGKQPRVALRAPEVHNTARDMIRQPLVQINKRGQSQAQIT